MAAERAVIRGSSRTWVDSLRWKGVRLVNPPARTTISYRALPNASDPRWVIPENRAYRPTSLALYAPQRVLGRVRKLGMEWGLLAGEPVAVANIVDLKSMLSDTLEVKDIEVALSLGTKGAYRKVTVLAMSGDGRPLAIAKIANRPLAAQALAQESAVLRKLEKRVPGWHAIPSVLMEGQWAGADVLVTSLGPMRPGPRHLGMSHAAFLATLRTAFACSKPFVESPIWIMNNRKLAELRPTLPSPLSAALEEGLDSIKRRLGTTIVPLTLAHRDFSPWNTQASAGGPLFVFDWEWAQEGYPTYFDAIHFVVMQCIKQRHQPRLPMTVLSPIAKLFGISTPEALRHACLVYLVDTALFYADARAKAPAEGGDDVLTWALDQILLVTRELEYGVA